MVAAARLRRAQTRVSEAAPYSKKMEELLSTLVTSAPEGIHPLLVARPVEKRAIVVLSSDRGLCGAFNASIMRTVEKEIRGDVKTTMIPLGKKGTSYLTRKKYDIAPLAPTFWAAFSYERASEFAAMLAEKYIDGTFDQIDVVYNEFVSIITQRPKVFTLLPIQPPAGKEDEVDRLYEPGRDQIIWALVPRAVEVRFYHACLHSLASEYGARMTAMDSATRNSREMIDKLTLDMNRARQAMITNELVEIISGAESLK